MKTKGRGIASLCLNERPMPRKKTPHGPTNLVVYSDTSNALTKCNGDIINGLEGLALQQICIVAVYKDTSPLQVMREAIPKPHVVSISLLPRAERVAA
jgi:hypothetical protein